MASVGGEYSLASVSSTRNALPSVPGAGGRPSCGRRKRPPTAARRRARSEAGADTASNRVCRRSSLTVSAWVWIATLVALVAVLAVDLLIIGRRPHEPSMKESSTWVALYVGLALLFGVGVWIAAGGRYAGEFYTGWLTEYSLSV